ncbi:MAG: YceI family protein [Bacteroidota bacterium]|nr:YceI family protein [Bacteroidota bacterium]
MKRLFTPLRLFLPLSLALTILLTSSVHAQQYTPVDPGSAVNFAIHNFGFSTGGHFTGLQGRIVFDPAHPADASFDVSVDAASVNTESDMRDNHLKKEEYFDVEKYPRIRFLSTAVTSDGKGGFHIRGKLTIKGITKDIDYPFIATPIGNDYIFKGQFDINRKDFGVGGTSTISNGLTVFLTVYAKKA